MILAARMFGDTKKKIKKRWSILYTILKIQRT